MSTQVNSLRRILSKARNPFFWKRRLKFAVRQATGWHTILVFKINPRKDPSPPPIIELGEARSREEARSCDFPWPDPTLRASRFGDYHRLFALEQDGHPVCYGWVSDQCEFAIEEVSTILTLDEPCIWIWDCVTPEPWRGRGYYPAMLKAILSLHAGRNVIIYVRKENTPSIRGIQKAGFEPWIEITNHHFGHRVRELRPATLHYHLQNYRQQNQVLPKYTL